MGRIFGLFILIGFFALQDAVVLPSISSVSEPFLPIAQMSYWILFIAIAYASLTYSVLAYRYQGHPRSRFFNLMVGSAFSFLSAKFIWFGVVVIIVLCNAFLSFFESYNGIPNLVHTIAFIGACTIASVSYTHLTLPTKA